MSVLSERHLNDTYNALLCKDGLHKKMDFYEVNVAFTQSVALRRNSIPRKSLNYKMLLEVFLRLIENDILSNLV